MGIKGHQHPVDHTFYQFAIIRFFNIKDVYSSICFLQQVEVCCIRAMFLIVPATDNNQGQTDSNACEDNNCEFFFNNTQISASINRHIFNQFLVIS